MFRSGRRLSFLRLSIAISVVIFLGYTLLTNWVDLKETVLYRVTNQSTQHWFAPYVDVTATPQFDFENLATTSVKNIVLSFIVSSSEDPCLPTWGNAYNLDEAGVALDLDRRIARFRQLEGDIAISLGGLLNNELAIKCTDKEKLYNAYKSIIDRYQVFTLDFDIEGEALKDQDSSLRRAEVVARIQEEFRNNNKDLVVWLTLPVTAQGLTEEGTNAVKYMLSNGVDLAGVNIMTMNYGQSRAGMSIKEATERALIETHRQLGILYRQNNINLSNNSLWKKIGATPMIGQNDLIEDVFTLEDAKSLNRFALLQGIVRLSMWSANRDIQCGDNYVNITVVSDSCSGIKQDRFEYSLLLGEGYSGIIKQNIGIVTVDDPEALENSTDDPSTSPYKIWSENDVYLEGTKVVWKRNVYQAKWWTQGDTPDNPVLQSWQTPWQLIGPVLPGEKPVAQLTLPAGTYAEWSGNKQYDEGDRVLFNGVPFQAKWWTQGDSPAASTSNPTSSPWVALTQKQVEEILKGQQ